jgi:hypothetical protein
MAPTTHSAVNAGGQEGSSIPCIKAKDPIGLSDRVPSFDIMKFRPLRVTRPDMLGVKLCL